MNLTIRKARESDRRYRDWKPYKDPRFPYDGPFKPWVVTVDGLPYVMVEVHDQVINVVWQNGSDAVPDLVRIFGRYLRAVPALADDLPARRRAERSRETWRRYHETVHRATREEAG